MATLLAEASHSGPRPRYAESLWDQPAQIVRGSSRRITIMRHRPAKPPQEETMKDHCR